MITKQSKALKSTKKFGTSVSRQKSLTDAQIIATARQYNKPADFRKYSNSAYKSAWNRGIMALCCAHMTDGNIKWTTESLKEAASQFGTRGEFKKMNARAYYAAHRLGILDECCQHMKHVYTQWTDKMIQAEADKYGTSYAFRIGNEPAWQAAQDRGFEKFSGHMTSKYKYWSVEAIHSEARKYKSRSEFAEKSSSAYQIACEKGIDQFCDHMEQKLKYYSYDELKTEAEKYKYRSQFAALSSNMYHASVRKGVRDDICRHMLLAPGASDNDVIYVWSMKNQDSIIHKVGVTSARRGKSRINECASYHKVKATILRYKTVLRADFLEKQILRIGTPVNMRGDGATEMRVFTDEELAIVLKMIDDA